jgi:hydrogenase maturation protease
MDSRRVLVAGVGNVLHGDDGFGVELAKRLAKLRWPEGVSVIETGIGGMTLVQELMLGYEALLLLDAHGTGGTPGTVRLLEPGLPDLSALDPHALRDYFADTHFATPLRALSLLERLGRLPARVAIIGCEPARFEELSIGLSEAVAAALDGAESLAARWIQTQLASQPTRKYDDSFATGKSA